MAKAKREVCRMVLACADMSASCPCGTATFRHIPQRRRRDIVVVLKCLDPEARPPESLRLHVDGPLFTLQPA
jgi:hypothetical protein